MIRARAERLANKATTVWKGPSLSEERQRTYLPDTGEQPKNYTIEDHHDLAEGSHTRHLFEEFRREVLAIDPCVSEEFLKLYVAYKAETNFVDVVPQATRLRLSLNMRFHELHDPRGLANDVTNIGRWGQRRCGGWTCQPGRTALRDGTRGPIVRKANGRRWDPRMTGGLNSEPNG